MIVRDLWSHTAWRVMWVAQIEALKHASDLVGPEHILLALAHEDNENTIAVLRSLKLDPACVRKNVIKCVNPGASVVNVTDEIRLTSEGSSVMVGALGEVLKLGHNQIWPEHLFLGLFHADSSFVPALLQDLGVTCQEARENLASLVAVAIQILHQEALEALEREKRGTEGACS